MLTKPDNLASLEVINPIRPPGTFPVWEGKYKCRPRSSLSALLK